MKTLDEVIEAIGFCKSGDLSKCKDCPYIGTCELDYAVLSDDALHYLREYRERHEEILRTEEALGYCEMYENPPLTWDELKQMGGKPVWVEFFYEDGQYFDSDWFLVGFVSESFCDVIGKLGTSRLVKNDYWQAYRKEKR